MAKQTSVLQGRTYIHINVVKTLDEDNTNIVTMDATCVFPTLPRISSSSNLDPASFCDIDNYEQRHINYIDGTPPTFEPLQTHIQLLNLYSRSSYTTYRSPFTIYPSSITFN